MLGRHVTYTLIIVAKYILGRHVTYTLIIVAKYMLGRPVTYTVIIKWSVTHLLWVFL